MIFRHIAATCFVTLFCTNIVWSQQSPDSLKAIPFAFIKGGHGNVINTNDFLDGINAHNTPVKHYTSVSAGFGVQTTGKTDWEHIHNFPQFGVAVYKASFDNEKEIGRPISILGFYKAPIFRRGNSAIMYNVGLGLTFNWKCYDYQTNPYNITIGSKSTVYLGLGFEYNYTIAKQLVVGAGVEATHFSNGATRKPNKGLNIATPYLTVSYLLNPMPKLQRRIDIERKRNNEIYIAIGGGIKRTECDSTQFPDAKPRFMDSKYYVGTISTAYMRQYGNRGKFGGGINIIYDDWLGSTVKMNGNKAEKEAGDVNKRFTLGVFASHEFCIDRLSIITQMGCYVLKSKHVYRNKPDINERAGIKYHFKNDMFAGVNIYAHQFSKADFIEWNIGRRFTWVKRNK